MYCLIVGIGGNGCVVEPIRKSVDTTASAFAPPRGISSDTDDDDSSVVASSFFVVDKREVNLELGRVNEADFARAAFPIARATAIDDDCDERRARMPMESMSMPRLAMDLGLLEPFHCESKLIGVRRTDVICSSCCILDSVLQKADDTVVVRSFQ